MYNAPKIITNHDYLCGGYYAKASVQFQTESSRFYLYKDFPESGSKPVWIQSRSQT